MATHIADVATSGIASIDYTTLRPQLQSGDLFFCSGNYLISKAIRSVTGSPWSHVGIILRLELIDRVLLLESVEDVGVRMAPLSKYVTDYSDGARYDGAMVAARRSGTTPAIVQGIMSFGLDQLTAPYDKDEMAGILARVTLKIGRVDRTHGFLCSELVNDCFRAAHAPLNCDQKDFVAPEDVWLDPGVQPLAVIA